MKAPSMVLLEDVATRHNTEACINGSWTPARPLGLCSIVGRFKLAWMVFAGKADALVWPGGQ